MIDFPNNIHQMGKGIIPPFGRSDGVMPSSHKIPGLFTIPTLVVI